MGVIYKARQLDLNRLVALKMLLAGSHAGSIDLVRFRGEAEVVASLQHPNIVQVYAIGKHSGLPFLSLEYVEGGPLSARLNGVPQLPKDAAALVETLSRGVHHAHLLGIVHRDLKPSNILIAADGTPKIADFGLAKRVKSSQGMTVTGAVLGTPNYMAPEQAESKKEIGPAADIYALGAIFYEMLTGRPPFRGPTPMDTIMQVISDEPVSPRRLQPKLARDLETICLKCLQKAPVQRYPSAEALANDLSRFREGRPILARPVSSFEHIHRWSRRNPVVATLSAVCILGVIVAALLLSQERSKTLSNLNRAENAERDLTDQLGLTIQAEQALTEQLWKSYSNTADAKRFSRRVGQRFESLEALTKAVEITRRLGKGEDVAEDLRKKAIGSLVLPDLRLEKELPGWNRDMTDYAIDKRFERYALRDKEGAISVRRIADGQEFLVLSVARQGTGNGTLSFSPNGSYLVLDGLDQQLQVWDLDRNKSIELPEGERTSVQAFSPDSQHIIFILRDGTFGLYDLPTGKLVRRLGKDVTASCTIAFHPDSSQIAALFPEKNKGLIQFWSVESGRLLGSIQQAGAVHLGSFSPDGRLLAVAYHGDSRIHIWDVQYSRRAGLLEGSKNSGIKVTFNPTFNLVASTGWENMLRFWDPLTGRQLLSMSNIEHSLTFNDRGDRILVNTERPQIWQLAGSREYRTFSGDPSRRNKTPYGGSISSNGRFLAVGSEDGTVIWELETGLELAYLRTGRTWNVLFHSSGDLLTTGEKGLLHWRIRSIPGTGQYRIEPPDPLIKEWTDGVSQSKDGHIVAVAISQKGCQIIDLNRPGELKPLFSHPGINKCSVSHDGAWVATGCFRNSGIKIWSVYDHQFVRDLPIEGGATPYFSADGRWLATNSGAGLQLWKVGTWELGRSVPNGRCLFSPDGSHLAIVRDTTITLMDPNTGRTFATVEDPNQDRIDNAFFSPDGSQLVASNDEKSSVNVWDLRLIRSGLKTLKLDWDLPDFSEPPVPNPSAVPIKMSGMGSLADQSASRLDPVKKTVLDLYLNPFDADAHLRLSDVLLRAGKSDTGRAHLLAALAFDPNLANTSSSSVRDALQMSGEALIRQSRWKEASADFSRLVQLEPQNSYRYLQAATLLLASGDRTGYQRMAKRMLDRFRNTNVPYEADHTAKACLITGDFQSEQAALARLAEVAETRGRNANSYRLYYQLCRGLSEYRQGRYSSALEWFARSRKTNTEEVNPIICPVAMNNLFEAMALHNLGRSEEARQSMVTAKSVIDNFGGPTTHFRSDWHEWLLCDVVRKEAERLLSEK